MERINLTYRKKIRNVGDNEIFEVHPVILGGSPSDASNKMVLTREKHIEAVRYWNKVIKELRDGDFNRGIKF